MRNLLYAVTVVLLVSCGAQSGAVRVESSGDSSMLSVFKEIPSVDAPVTGESVGNILEFLSSDVLKGRDTGEEGLEKAAHFIAGYFQSIGVKPYYPAYRDTLTNIKETAFNVVGYLEGQDPELKDEFVILGAHYDHIGLVDPVNGDNIANGANDNASGTTAVMEIARKMAMEGSNKRSVMFVLFAAEEQGLKGSFHLAEKLQKEGVQLYAMLNFEMVGVPLDKDYLAYLTGYEMSTMAETLNSFAGDNLIGFLPQAKAYKLFQRSDNYPFYDTFKVPAQTVCTFDFTNFEFYHKPGDEFELMDLDHMAGFINRMVPVVSSMVNSEGGVIRMKKGANRDKMTK